MSGIERLTPQSLDELVALPAWVEPAPSPDTTKPLRDEEEAYRNAIRDALLRQDAGFLHAAPFTLLKSLQIAAEAGRATSELYGTFNQICDALRGQNTPRFVAPFSDTSAWSVAIASARALRALTDHTIYDLGRFCRQKAVADAVVRLEKGGYPVQISTFGPVIETKALEQLCKRIDHLIEALGGRPVVEAILTDFRMKGRIYFDTLLCGRQAPQVPSPRPPSLPVHYLYNLGLKHFNSTPTSRDWKADFVQTQELARDMAAVFDCEFYSSFEQMGISVLSFDHSINDRVVYDELFSFPQWQPDAALALLPSWLRALESLGSKLPKFSLSQWEEICRALLQKAPVSALLITHPSEYVSATISAADANALFAALAVPVASLNSGYLSPVDTAKRNSAYYPLYKVSNDLYVLPPKAFVGRALFERIFALLRDARTPKLDNKMGDALEILTADALALTGFPATFRGEKYLAIGPKGKSKEYEVDVAREFTARLEMFECKRKPLTNKARQGNSLAASLDFARGFLHPLEQINRHEKQLRSGGITFLSGRRLELGTRDILRVAVTMTDHGTMRDPLFISAMMRDLWGAELNAVDPASQPDADEVTEAVKAVTQSITDLAALEGVPLDRFFQGYLHRIWWLGVDQLYFICANSDDIITVLRTLQTIVFGSTDFMAEIHNAEKSGLLKRENGRLVRRRPALKDQATA